MLLGYFSILIYTPIHMIEMAEMNMPMEHCPFAMSQHVICTMTISQHIREWQNWLQSLLPSFKVVLTTSFFFAFAYLIVVYPPLLRLLLYCRQRGKIKAFTFLNYLFSQGILHSKAY